ncbi:MAG TPA: hypothetical protein VEG62_08985 [Acidimicrobiales bacterium]|nr:hypothetical protein [Acidimicrobiales bacterium]
MTAGWTAAGVRGRGLLRRRLGHSGALALASEPSLESALSALLDTPYSREIRPGQDLGGAQHAVSATALWHMRILAGWGSPVVAGPLRLLGSGYEIPNVTGHLLGLSGHPVRPAYTLGALATAWPAVQRARTAAEVRAALRDSAWGDPGSEELPSIRLALQLSWACRVADGVPPAVDWATSGAALAVARALASGAQGSLGPTAVRDASRVLGQRWRRADSPEDLARHVPRAAAQTLEGVASADQLWRAEVRWWAEVEATAARLAVHPRPDSSAAVGAAALLAVDAWRVRAALTVAARGGGELAEVLDAVA